MRIALLHPTYWPEVRRGSERLVHDVGLALARRGHEVSILTTHPGRTDERVEDGVRVLRSRRPPPLPRTKDLEYFALNAPVTALRLLQGEYDLAHAFFSVDAWAATKVRRLGGPPVVFSFHGIPDRRFLVARRRRLELILAAAREARAVSVLSEAAAGPFRRYLQREPQILPGGVFSSDFDVEASRSQAPTLICAGSLGDPRKGGVHLAEAFRLVRQSVPAARLVMAGGRDPFMSRASVKFADGIEMIDADRTSDLASAYASAWASVLPATKEAFGLVLIESLAAGTPAIALRSGACPEILVDEQLGRLVQPGDVPALAEVIVGALREPPSAEVAAACRSRAADFDWDRVVRLYEDFHALALEHQPTGPVR
jgi:glycosyltransferase involved in cell wall biosynthesis